MIYLIMLTSVLELFGCRGLAKTDAKIRNALANVGTSFVRHGCDKGPAYY